MTAEEIEAIVGGYHGDAFRVLGPHGWRKKNQQASWEVRAFLPQAESAAVLAGGNAVAMEKCIRSGFFCAQLPGDVRGAYRLRAKLVGRARDRDRRPLPLRAADFRFRPLPAHRGHAVRGLSHLGRARDRRQACASRCGRRTR